VANHVVTYHDDSQRASEGKPAKEATKSWAACSCGWKSMEVRLGLKMTRPGMKRMGQKHLRGEL
jgi:hypothetical protein